MKTEFSTSLDKWSGGITLALSVIFVLALAGLLFGTNSGSTPFTASLVAAVILGGVLLFCYLLRPVRYQLSGGSLYIARPGGSKRISLASLEKVQQVAPEDLRWTLRTFGNGGVFGFYGNFWNRKLGHMTWYATRRSNYVLIKTATKSFILTPDDPERFVQAVSAVPVAVAG